ncbi:MAG: hypothetical protein ACRD1P_11800 [Thermoanaerobaculia bacterium]
MKRLVLCLTVVCVAAMLSGCSLGPRLIVAPLDHSAANVGALYPESERAVTVTVKDQRGPGQILGGGLLGPIYLGYVTEKDNELLDLMRSAANDTVRALGMKSGGGATLELTIEDFRVTMYRTSGFSPMNCIGYGKIQTVVRLPDGSETKKSFNVTYFEGTVPVVSMKEVARKAVTRIYRQAAWEATAATLASSFPVEADPARVRRLLGTLDTTKDDDALRTTIFWLGLVGENDPAVKEKLFAIFRTSKTQNVRQAAAESLGMLGVQDAREEMEAILAGKRKVGDWDNTDMEEDWYLLCSLHRLGVGDLRSRIPKSEINMRRLLTELVQFKETGEIPRLSESEQQELEKARKNLKT